MSRKLVTVRQVIEILPIVGADKIELAKIDGWQVIVKKGDFEPGMQGFYFEIDSLLPLDNEAFAFLQRPGATRTHHRLKTIKMKGTLSQGLLLRLSDLPKLWDYVMLTDEGEQNIAGYAGITKYEPPLPGEPGSPSVITFPNFIPRTELERVQNLSRDVTLAIANTEPETFEVQAKYDGTSITAYYCPDVWLPEFNSHEFGVCSRNQNLSLDAVIGRDAGAVDSMYLRAATDAGWLRALWPIAEACGGTIAIQGELVGPSIQGNRMNLPTRQAFAFDIYSCNHGRYLTRTERDLMWGLVEFKTGVRIAEVDTIAEVWPLTAPSDILVDFMGECERSVKYPLEGIVYKSRRPGGLRFKAISNSYLLKFGE